MAPTQAKRSEPKRHHFVPKFYLRHFADHKRRIRAYRRGERRAIVTSVLNAAVESGFYTVVEQSGEESQRIEALLAMVDGDARSAIDRMLKGEFPPAPQTREALALFMAFQILRTPEQRRQYEAMFDYTQKVMLEGWTPQYVRARLDEKGLEITDQAVAQVMDVVQNPDRYRFVPHQNEHVQLMLGVAANIAPVISRRSWLIGTCRTATFITSDHPVVWRSAASEATRHLGVGVGNAEEVYFPLDRRHVLMMALPEQLPERAVELPTNAVLFVNHLEAESSHNWVYQHPEDEPVTHLIPDRPRPVIEINGRPVYEDA